MAYKDSDELKTDERYSLGDYSFRIERSSVPGSTNDKIEAICTDKDGKNARKSIQVVSSTKINGWYVEANETEASVYVNINEPPIDTGGIYQPVPCAGSGVGSDPGGAVANYTFISGSGLVTSWFNTSGGNNTHLWASSEPGAVGYYSDNRGSTSQRPCTSTYTFNGKTVYYSTYTATWTYPSSRVSLVEVCNGGAPVSNVPVGAVAWAMVYGDDEGSEDTLLVGRFAIELEDAGGVGPGSDWVDPGDYDPDWEEGDPTHTLYVTVTGALSGRHNDPIEDPSYSYIPADKDTVKDYGCGGDGGHGGGGGAGASTVVVHKFATNQANSKEVTAIARRHGYGSGGGKGGKGGDGCILIYY